MKSHHNQYRRRRGGRISMMPAAIAGSSSSSCSLRRLSLLLLLLLLLCSAQLILAAEKCSGSATLYRCPLSCDNDNDGDNNGDNNSDGILVADCLDCDGYLSTDADHDICFDRKLFRTANSDPDDHDDHYHYLWNDLVGAVVWFVMAGVATACGVGGGGIYVPLGILLFQFSPKQASGLSQTSIFGASLGGLLLNLRNRLPTENIRSDAGVVVAVVPPNSGNDSGGGNDRDDSSGNKCRRHLQSKNTAAQDAAYLETAGHDNKFYTRPLINYDMALFLAPMEMAGAVLGVLVQKVLPNWLYLLVAGLVLSFTAYKTYKKFFDVRRKEKAAELEAQLAREKSKILDETIRREMEARGDGAMATATVEICAATSVGHGVFHENDDSIEVTTDITANGDAPSAAPAAAIDNNNDNNPLDDGEKTVDEQPPPQQQQQEQPEDAVIPPNKELELRQKYLEDDMRQYPKEKIAALILLWIGLFVLTLLKGGKGVESLVGITCQSKWYGVLIAAQFGWMFAFALYYGFALVRRQRARVAVRYPYLPNDPVWDRPALRFYGAFTFVAGIVAGLIGIGGGMVLGPLMLVMDIHPRVSSATTATMIVLTSSSVAVIFVTSGLVPWTYAVFYFGVCFVGAVVGKTIIDGYVKRTGRASLLIFILATIIALATIGCFVIMFLRIADKNWCLDGFKAFCNVRGTDIDCGVGVDRVLHSFHEILGT